jgi:uncharacterized membrane protein
MFTATHLHAMVIHFPIALLLIGYIFEIISLFSKNIFYRQSSFALLFIGTIGVLFAYFTGNAAGDGMEDGTMFRAMKLHEQSATFTLCIACSTAIYYSINYYFHLQKTGLKIIGIILFTITVAAISRTGYLGGQLVYKHGAGVQLEMPDFNTQN